MVGWCKRVFFFFFFFFFFFVCNLCLKAGRIVISEIVENSVPKSVAYHQALCINRSAGCLRMTDVFVLTSMSYTVAMLENACTRNAERFAFKGFFLFIFIYFLMPNICATGFFVFFYFFIY